MAQITDDLIPLKLTDQIIGEITAAEYEGLTDTAFHVTVQMPSDRSYREKVVGWCVVTDAHRIVAREALALLNRELHHDGAWVFVWYAPTAGMRQPADALILFKDKDGDLITSAEIKNPLARIYRGEPVDFGGIAAKAIDRTLSFWRDVEVKESQTRKAAQGQASANPIPGAAIAPESPIA